jgi:hypothetical protein
MPKTLADIITATRERLDEPTAARWSDTEIRRWTNQGARDMCRESECLQTSGTVNAVVGQATYTLPTSMTRVHHVTYTPTGGHRIPLDFKDFNHFDRIGWNPDTRSTPQIFALWDCPPTLQLVVYPTPSTTGVFTIYYYKLPTELAVNGDDDAEDLNIPEGWDDAVLDYVEMMARRKDGDAKWQECKALYEEKLDELKRLTRRFSDQPGSFSPNMPSLGGIDSWLYSGEDW